MPGKVYLALVHYPVYNKNGQVISTSVTNLDLHDIARVAATYGVEKYFVVHPLEAQQRLVQEILGYWRYGYGARYNPSRCQAFDRLQVVESLEAARRETGAAGGSSLLTVCTTARSYPESIGYRELRQLRERDERDLMLLFGTGWGLAQSVIDESDLVLEPIRGSGKYNHLSVRSAVAIILDRLLGENWWQAR